MPGRYGLRGHLREEVSALVDGQLDPVAEERAWAHVHGCPTCRWAVEQEGWTKRRLQGAAEGEPSARLLGSLYSLAPVVAGETEEEAHARRVRDSWAAVAHLERQGRGRRRAGLAVAGAGSVSAAVIGLSALGGATLGIGGAAGGSPSPSATPTASLGGATPSRTTRPAPVVFPTAGPAAGWQLTDPTATTRPVRVTGR